MPGGVTGRVQRDQRAAGAERALAVDQEPVRLQHELAEVIRQRLLGDGGGGAEVGVEAAPLAQRLVAGAA